jgi:hypothetical protein
MEILIVFFGLISAGLFGLAWVLILDLNKKLNKSGTAGQNQDGAFTRFLLAGEK